jgi:hypothetical protein
VILRHPVARFLSLMAQTEDGRRALQSGAVDRLTVLDLKRWRFSQESTTMQALDRALSDFHTQCGSGSNQSADVCMQLASQLAQTGAQVLLPCVGHASDQPVQFRAEWIAKKQRALQQDPADQDKDWAVRLETCLMAPTVSRPCSSRTNLSLPLSHPNPFWRSGTQVSAPLAHTLSCPRLCARLRASPACLLPSF